MGGLCGGMEMDLIDRQAAIDVLDMALTEDWEFEYARDRMNELPSVQPEQPPYVAEIEAEYQKAVKMPHIHKPLAKALYEVWKKHDREDAERRTDGN